MKKNSTVILVECVLVIAPSTVLSMIRVLELPQGDSITLASMAPLVLVSYHHGVRWGLGTIFVHSLLWILLQFNAPPAKTLTAFALVVLLDYVLTFTMLGNAAFWDKPIRNRSVSIAFDTAVAVFLRFLCSSAPSILIWDEYAPEGTSIWLCSLTYNRSYVLPEFAVISVTTTALIKMFDRTGNYPTHAVQTFLPKAGGPVWKSCQSWDRPVNKRRGLS